MTRPVRLLTAPREPREIRFQVHALEPWTDPIFKVQESYLAGFASEEKRAEYVERNGWSTGTARSLGSSPRPVPSPSASGDARNPDQG